mmetsp:Transcript_2495/g.8776  ORF Transcript_2495/g.8776 Transcript_2495/m.8776 type:complete len:231 (-) Transcript_2495:773-1465(-)
MLDRRRAPRKRPRKRRAPVFGLRTWSRRVRRASGPRRQKRRRTRRLRRARGKFGPRRLRLRRSSAPRRKSRSRRRDGGPKHQRPWAEACAPRPRCRRRGRQTPQPPAARRLGASALQGLSGSVGASRARRPSSVFSPRRLGRSRPSRRRGAAGKRCALGCVNAWSASRRNSQSSSRAGRNAAWRLRAPPRRRRKMRKRRSGLSAPPRPCVPVPCKGATRRPNRLLEPLPT